MRIQTGYQAEDTSGANLSASQAGIRQFQEAGFGLSVHWGLYCLSTHGGEWIYWQDHIPYRFEG